MFFTLIDRRGGEVDSLNGKRGGGRNDLHGSSVFAAKRGTQYFVTPDNFGERALQRLDIQLSLEAYSTGNVIDSAAGLQLIEEPESLLRE